MKPINYWQLQMRLEGILFDAYGCLVSAAAEAPDFPLVVLVRTVDGEVEARPAGKLPGELHGELAGREPGSLTNEALLGMLGAAGIQAKAERFATYVFPGHFEAASSDDVLCLAQGDRRVEDFGFGGMPGEVYAIESQGRILSACVSSRQDAACAEAWVVTESGHRRRGLAKRVVTAWAGNLLRKGLIPFFSHAIENEASAGLAGSLGLIPVFNETVITPLRREASERTAADAGGMDA